MRNLCLVVGAALFLGGTNLSAANPKPLTGNHSLYLSAVKKNTVDRFLNRFSTSDAQVVVTRQPVGNAIASKTLSTLGSPHLILVELESKDAAPLRGERARIGNAAIVALPEGVDAHDYVGLKRYSEDIASQETLVQLPKTALVSHIESRDFVSKLTVEQSFLEEKLKEFSGATSANLDGKAVTLKERGTTAGRANARAYLKQEYEAIGFTTSQPSYSSGLYSGANFVAEKAGTDPSKVLVLTSHMDDMTNAGADDNGSGTIGALAIATALKDETLRYTLRIVAFDQEEKGLVGSAAYAKALKSAGTINQLVGLINLEMTGYDADDDGAFHSIDCDEGTSADLTAALMKVVNRDTELRLKKVEACTNRSDHASFWKYNVPAIVISQNFFGGDDNPCYHLACDKVDKVQFDYMTRLTTAVGRAVEELLAETPSSTSRAGR